MQAPLSSTASGQQLRTGPFSGLPTSPLGSRTFLDDVGIAGGQANDPTTRRRMRAGAALAPSLGIVAEGAGLAHDAGNLLGALRLYCDLLARPGILRDEHRHYAEELQLLSRRSGALIDRLLNPATTRRECAGERRAQERVIVPEVVEQCRGLLNMIARRAVEVTYEAGISVPVSVSREAVERILVNLTKNAAEASAGGGAIRLRVCRVQEDVGAAAGKVHTASEPTRIALSVEDQGCGMSVAAVKVLLGEGPAEPPSGPHGLGLRVVRELVRASGGELRLKSRSGCGTTVEIAWAVAGEDAAGDGNKRNGNGIEGGVSC